MKKKFLLTVFIFVIVFLILKIVSFYFYPKNQNQVCFKDDCFIVELAKTTQERTQGLMFREKLDLNKGMLFVFENEGEYSFWMKNTLINLDIIWINKDKEVVFISKNVQPCNSNSCLIFNPDKKAQYILELNGGVTDKIGLNVGDKVIFNREF